MRVKFTLPVDFRIAGAEAPAGQGTAPEPSATTVEEIAVVSFAQTGGSRPDRQEIPVEKPVTVQVQVFKENKPLSGALVQEMGSDKGAVTGADGKGRTQNIHRPYVESSLCRLCNELLHDRQRVGKPVVADGFAGVEHSSGDSRRWVGDGFWQRNAVEEPRKNDADNR